MAVAGLELLNGLHPALQPYALYTIRVFEELTGGTVTVTITSVYRSIEKQAELYANRRFNPYPVNKPGDSAHNFRLAWDSDVPDAYMPLWKDVRRAVGWDVPDNDEVHAGYPGWRDYVPQVDLERARALAAHL